MTMQTIDWKKYIFVLFITAAIFFTAISFSTYLSNKRVEEIRSVQEQISLDILSSEVQTALLEQFSCKDVSGTALSRELGALGEKLSFAEESRNADDPEVLTLKKTYSLIEIKDYLLMNRVREKCGTQNVFIVYFYGKDCDECRRQGLVLTKLREDYPELRVYSFDYNLDVAAIATLVSINKIENTLPALLIDENVYYGFQGIENIEEIIPQLKVWKEQKEKEKQAIEANVKSAPEVNGQQEISQ